MFTQPDALRDDAIRAALADHWSLEAERVRYAPVGFGSHHWVVVTTLGERLFVTVDDLAAKRRSAREPLDQPLERLRAAFSTARELADAGHEFVVAPRPASDGEVLQRLDERFTVACFPYVDGVVGEFGRYRCEEDRRAVAQLLAVLHELDPTLSRHCGIEDFELSHREELIDAIEASDRWGGGPYGESARSLLHGHAHDVVGLLRHYDARVSQARETESSWRLTHGEPHGSNVLVSGERRYLIDWDTALIAPRERDLWHLDPDDATATQLYENAGGHDVDTRLLDLYRVQWELSEIAGYVALLRAEHEDTDDVRESFRNLRHYVTAISR